MGLPKNEQYIRGMALESATAIMASDDSVPIEEVLDVADRFVEYIISGRAKKEPEVGRIVVTEPLKAGDRIQYKLDPNSRLPHVRINSGLELTLKYLGTTYVIYEWASRSMQDNSVVDSGEVQMSREEFNNKIERWTGKSDGA